MHPTHILGRFAIYFVVTCTVRKRRGWRLPGHPAGTEGYDDLARTADTFQLFGHRVLIAAVDDLIRMKRAAGRPKDLLAIEELGALRHELDRPQ